MAKCKLTIPTSQEAEVHKQAKMLAIKTEPITQVGADSMIFVYFKNPAELFQLGQFCPVIIKNKR